MLFPSIKITLSKNVGNLFSTLPELDRPERCTNCRLQYLYGRTLCGVCQLTCPDQAIHWVEEGPYELMKVAIEY